MRSCLKASDTAIVCVLFEQIQRSRLRANRRNRNGASEGSWSGQGALTSRSIGTPKRLLASAPQTVLSA